MISWIDELFGKGIAAIMNGVEKLYTLANNINSIQFDELIWINQFFGLLRYLLGDPLYIAMSVFFDIALGFVIYKIIKRIVEIISGLFVKIKGKFIIP